MFTRRAGVGSAEARRPGANGARIEGSDVRIGGPEQKFGSRPKQGVRRLGNAAVEKCIVIL